MENLVITINGFEYVKKDNGQDVTELQNKIKELEDEVKGLKHELTMVRLSAQSKNHELENEVADLEDELGRAMSKYQDLEDELCSVHADRDEYEHALNEILRIANRAV